MKIQLNSLMMFVQPNKKSYSMELKQFVILFIVIAFMGHVLLAKAGQFEEGIAAYQQKDYETAIKLLRPFAMQGNADSQSSMGYMYQNGLGVSQDYSEALKWYHKAADQGDASAQNNIGNMYFKGDGLKQDYSEALKWYRMAASKGDSSGQFNLGAMYAHGYGTSRDNIEAEKWFRKAADQGNMEAKRYLEQLTNKKLSCILETPSNLAGVEIEYSFNEETNTLWASRGGTPENIRISDAEIAYQVQDEKLITNAVISRNSGRLTIGSSYSTGGATFLTGNCTAVAARKF